MTKPRRLTILAVTVLLLIFALCLLAGHIATVNTRKHAQLHLLGRQLESFVRTHGRMPSSWEEMIEEGYIMRRGDVMVIPVGESSTGKKFIIEEDGFSVLFGITGSDLRRKDAESVLESAGRQRYLLQTQGIRWPYHNHLYSSQFWSRRIREAMVNRPPPPKHEADPS